MSRSQRTRPAVRPSTASPRFDPYLLAVLLLPLIVLWHQDNTLFTPPGYIDPWFYLGFFRDLAEFKRNLFPDLYYGSRLSWILPGYLVHSLFSPVVANCVLHLTVHSVATFSLFSILRLTAGVRSAFLTTMVFCVNPWLWAATGWDYVDGAGIAYCLLEHGAADSSRGAAAREVEPGNGGSRVGGVDIYESLLDCARTAAAAVLCRSGLDLAPYAADPFTRLIMPLGRFGIRTGHGSARRHQLSAGRPFLVLRSFVARRAAVDVHEEPVVSNHLVRPSARPWLWFSAIAVIAAIVLLPFRARKGAAGRKAAGLLFSVQLLLAVAIMGYTQATRHSGAWN